MTARSQIILVVFVLALAGALDFVQRIYVPRSEAMREPSIETTVLPERPLPLASARERLQSWFPASAPEVPVADALDSHGDSGERVPDRAEIGGWRFILRGVFDAGPHFAVFDIVSGADGAIEQHRLSAGDTIKGVRVQQISGRKVSLRDRDNVVELALFIDPEDDRVSAKEKDE